MKQPPLLPDPARARHTEEAPLAAKRQRKSSQRSRRKAALLFAGAALVALGVVLGIIPIVPGTPIVLVGVGMVATHSPRGRWLRWRVGAWLRRRGVRLPARLGGRPRAAANDVRVTPRARACGHSESRSHGYADQRAR